MSLVYISSRKDSEKILKYDFQFGSIAEKYKAELNENVVAKKSCYIKNEDGYLGVCGSKLGPVLFINKGTYFFNDKEWSATLEKIGEKNIFSLIGKARILYQLTYRVPSIDLLDPYSDDLSVDFYAWLCKKRNNSEFIEMWSE